MTVDAYVARPDGDMDFMVGDWDDALEQYVDDIPDLVDCIEPTLMRAKRVAEGENVQVMGGAQTAHQWIESSRCDELRIHLGPHLRGKGAPLLENLDPAQLELENESVISTADVTHLHFPVRAGR